MKHLERPTHAVTFRGGIIVIAATGAVIDHDDAFLKLGLTDDERRALIEYLKSL